MRNPAEIPARLLGKVSVRGRPEDRECRWRAGHRATTTRLPRRLRGTTAALPDLDGDRYTANAMDMFESRLRRQLEPGRQGKKRPRAPTPGARDPPSTGPFQETVRSQYLDLSGRFATSFGRRC